MPKLDSLISRIIADLTDESVEKLINMIDTGMVSNETRLYEIKRIELFRQISSPVLYDFLDSWKNSGFSSKELVFGLRTALETKRRIQLSVPQIEMVWTGPYPPAGGIVRSTYAVISEMLVNAKRQIMLVGYSLTSSSTFPATIIEQLIYAKRRGCDVKIALHDDGLNFKKLRQAWPKQIAFPTLLKWIGNTDDEMASLHAKMLLVDRNELLITSANLTHHGLSSNIEVGARIKGNVVHYMTSHFQSLERAGILQRVEVDEK